MNPPTRKRFRAEVLTKVRIVGRHLGPDDDWGAFMLADTPTGLAIIPLFGLDEADALPTLSALLVQQRARLAARIQAAWLRHPVTGERIREVVVVYIADAEGLEAWQAEVTREGHTRPQLGEWKAASVGGPVADSLQAALAVAYRQS